MTPNLESRQADQILDSARAQRRRWPGAGRLPGWFRGGELDVLDAGERHGLYLRTVAAQPTSPWIAWILLLVWTPKGIDNILADHHRGLWLGGAALFAFAIVGATLLRRRNVVTSARRELRESADWPLRQRAREAV